MTKFDYPEEQILSGFTLAFLDDLPYLHVIKNYTGGLMKFGKHKGCEFFYNYCGNSSNSLSTFANEFYLPSTEPTKTQEPSCSSGRLSKTIYKLREIETSEKTDTSNIFEYFIGDKEKAGEKSTNYCPFAQYYYEPSETRSVYSGHCSEKNLTEKDNDRNEVLGENSFCVLSSLRNEGSSDTEVKALCYEMICSSQSLTIKVGDYYFVCPRGGGKINAKNLEGYLLCPDYNLICTSSPMCNNLLDCIKNGSKEIEETFDYDYNEIKTTQNPTVYTDAEINYGWELTHEGSCPFECMQCISKTNCIRCRPHYIYKNSECIYAIEHCLSFENEENDVCTKCESGFILVEEGDNKRFCENLLNKDEYYLYNNELQIYKKCELLNCKICSSGTECQECKPEFNFVEDDNNLITCQKIDTNKYYQFNSGNKTYYKKCSKSINNCEECSSENYCIKCLNNYAIINGDHTKCESLLEEKYYYDNSSETFKLCSDKIETCELCTTYGDIICKQCFSNYAVKHENDITCKEISFFLNNAYFYTNDNGKNYYSCSLYNEVDNCEQCSNKEFCNECKIGYNKYNENKLCATQGDIDNNIYIFTNGNLMLCSSLIQDCHRCNDSSTCLECQEEAGLIDNDTCVNINIIEENKNYYKDEKTNRYISCSIMDNCITCESGSVCTSCQEGFILNDNKLCHKIDEDDDDGLSTGAIIGIVFGCVGFLLIVAGIVYYLISKVFKTNKSNIPNEMKDDVKISEEKKDTIFENEENAPVQKDPMTTKNKRSIHNV